MKVFLFVAFLIGGEWVNGEEFDGWAKREQPSMDVCVERSAAVMKSTPPEGAKGIMSFCLEMPA